MGEERRRWARAGIAALNIVTPGLGLMRIGRWKIGFAFLALGPLSGLLCWIGLASFGPTATFAAFVAFAVAAIILFLGTYGGATILSYRKSRFRSANLAWWSRWYGLGTIVLCWWATSLALPELRQFQRSFYIPAASMMPLLQVNDRLVADMRSRTHMTRGEVVLYQSQGIVRVGRVAAIGGDRIALKDGVVILNGAPVARWPRPDRQMRDPETGQPIQLFEERFPGEASGHLIADAGWSLFDDFAEESAKKGHVFILGDNRDFSADSRVPLAAMGVGQPPVNDIIGRPLFLYWSNDPTRRGLRIAG